MHTKEFLEGFYAQMINIRNNYAQNSYIDNPYDDFLESRESLAWEKGYSFAHDVCLEL